MPLKVQAGGGAGFPDGWKDKQTGEAFEAIAKNAPVVMQHYGSWDTQLNSLPPFAVPPAGQVQDVSFSPDGQYCAVVTNATPFLFLYKTGVSFVKLPNLAVPLPKMCQSVNYTNDNKYLLISYSDISGSSRTSRMVAFKRNGEGLIKLTAELLVDEVRKVVFHPDGIHFFILGGTRYESGINAANIAVFEFKNEIFSSRLFSESYIMSAAWSASGTILATVSRYTSSKGDQSWTTTTYLVSIAPFLISRKDSKNNVSYLTNGICFSVDDTHLLVGQYAPSRRLDYTLNDGMIGSYTITNLTTPQEDLSTTSDGKYLAQITSGDLYLRLYEFSSDGHSLIDLPAPSKLPKAARKAIFSPTSEYLAVWGVESYGSYDCVFYLTHSKEIVCNLNHFHCSPLSWLPAGEFGISLESKAIGEQCKVNLFPALNNIQEVST